MQITTRTATLPPQARLEITGLPASTVTVRVRRSWAGVEAPCPDATLVQPVGGTWAWTDHGLPATHDAGSCVYTVEGLGAGGAVVDTDTVSVPTAVVGHSEAWLSDPLDPLAAIRASVTDDTSPPGWASSGAVVAPLGGVAVSLGTRRARTREWGLAVEDPEAWRGLWRMIDRGGTLLLRTDPGCVDHPTGLVHLHIDDAQALPALPHDVWRGVQLRATEVAPPLHAVAVVARSYADTSAEYSSYQRTRAALPTYADRSRGSR